MSAMVVVPYAEGPICDPCWMRWGAIHGTLVAHPHEAYVVQGQRFLFLAPRHEEPPLRGRIVTWPPVRTRYWFRR